VPLAILHIVIVGASVGFPPPRIPDKTFEASSGEIVRVLDVASVGEGVTTGVWVAIMLERIFDASDGEMVRVFAGRVVVPGATVTVTVTTASTSSAFGVIVVCALVVVIVVVAAVVGAWL
jgi:hypothetical protein